MAPAPAHSPSLIRFCVALNEVRTQSGFLVQSLLFDEPGADDLGEQLSVAVENAASAAPDDVLDQYLAVRAEWLRIEAVLEGANYDGANMRQADKDQVTGALEAIIDELLGPLRSWTDENC